MSTRVLAAALLAFSLVIPACAVDTDELADEDIVATDNALVAPVREGATFKTTARLNLREGGSQSAEILFTMPKGAIVTILDTARSSAGYYNVSYDGTEGWAHSSYLQATSVSSSTTGADKSGTSGNDVDEDQADDAPTGNVVSSGSCKASYYASGSQTANGERFNPDGLTAAHKTLPFDTKVRVTNTANGKSVTVRINDRGPFVTGRCLDLARGAFRQIASLDSGVVTAKYEVLE